MKPVIQLVAVSLLASSVGLTALTGCSAPTPATLGDGTEDPSAGDSTQSSGKLPAKKPTNTGSKNTPAPAPAADPTPASATPPATTPPVTTPAPAGNPQACMDQCAATGPAATYWTCSAKCQDQACDDNCWNPTCGQNAQACESALATCDTKCGLPPGGP